MKIRPIKTKRDYERALAFVASNFEAKPDSEAAELMEVIAILIEKYEEEHFPIKAPTPVQAIRFRMEQLGMSTNDLVKIVGTRGRVSEILRGRRTLSIRMIKLLHKKLQVPTEVLLGS